jgi:hypothetical protein
MTLAEAAERAHSAAIGARREVEPEPRQMRCDSGEKLGLALSELQSTRTQLVSCRTALIRFEMAGCGKVKRQIRRHSADIIFH